MQVPDVRDQRGWSVDAFQDDSACRDLTAAWKCYRGSITIWLPASCLNVELDQRLCYRVRIVEQRLDQMGSYQVTFLKQRYPGTNKP